MFTNLLNTLHREHRGEEIYVPDALYDTLKGWVCHKYNKDPLRLKGFSWKKKKVLPYDEDLILQAYQSTPMYIPERILEKSLIFECSLDDGEYEDDGDIEVEIPKKKPTRTRSKVTGGLF